MWIGSPGSHQVQLLAMQFPRKKEVDLANLKVGSLYTLNFAFRILGLHTFKLLRAIGKEVTFVCKASKVFICHAYWKKTALVVLYTNMSSNFFYTLFNFFKMNLFLF